MSDGRILLWLSHSEKFQVMTVIKTGYFLSSYTSDLKLDWHVKRRVKMWFTFRSQQIQNPQRFCCENRRGPVLPHLDRSDVTLPPLACSEANWSPFLIAHPSNFPASSTARSPDATARWAVFHKEISTLPVKCCFSLWLLMYSVWRWQIHLRGKWAPVLAGRRHVQLK